MEIGFLEARILKPWESHYSGNASLKSIYRSLHVQGTLKNRVLNKVVFSLGQQCQENFEIRVAIAEGYVCGKPVHLCKKNQKLADHLILHCDFLKLLWV